MTSVKAGIIRDILVESMSDGHVCVLDKLDEPKYDEDVATELDLKATIIRTLLNDLHENGLVEYQRTKNKKTGWYTYLWVRRDEKVAEFGKKYVNSRINELSGQLEDETKSVSFDCGCTRVPYHVAIDKNFECPSCTNSFSECDNGEIIDGIVGEVTRLNSMLEMI